MAPTLNRRAIAGAAAAAALAAPAVALACPYCAGRNDGGTAQLVILGLFVFFPFAIVATIVRIIKAGSRDA